MATSSELLFRDLLNEPMHFCLARLERLKKQSLYYLIIKNGGVITGAEVDTCSHTIILVGDSDTYYSNYIDGVPIFKASYINECIEKKRVLDISQFVMSNVFIADENFSYMDVVYKRKYEWIKLLPSLKIPEIEMKPSRSLEDGSLPTPIDKIEMEPKTSRSQDDGLFPTPIQIPHQCQFKCGVQTVTAQNLRQHYLEAHGTDFYTACCFCCAKCFSRQDFLVHTKQCRLRTLLCVDGADDLYWEELEELEYDKMTHSKLAYDYVSSLPFEENVTRSDLRYPPHLFGKKMKLECVWKLGHCALAKWAETDPDAYDAVCKELDDRRLDIAFSEIPSTVFSMAFKEAMKDKEELPEDLCYLILKPCQSECMHPYSVMDMYRVDDESESNDETADTYDNSLETAQNASIEPDRTNENTESVLKPNT